MWAHEIAESCGGRLVGPDVSVDGASIDSRDLADGSLFVPIVDVRDGHDFVGEALHRGAAAFLTSRPLDAVPGWSDFAPLDEIAAVSSTWMAAALVKRGGARRPDRASRWSA
jgi:UDP-N-acetylmuramoyl-tripeptide--D-alanyl-D-alanine ligase